MWLDPLWTKAFLSLLDPLSLTPSVSPFFYLSDSFSIVLELTCENVFILQTYLWCTLHYTGVHQCLCPQNTLYQNKGMKTEHRILWPNLFRKQWIICFLCRASQHTKSYNRLLKVKYDSRELWGIFRNLLTPELVFEAICVSSTVISELGFWGLHVGSTVLHPSIIISIIIILHFLIGKWSIWETSRNLN
jgi:hypothetical protein